MGMHWLYFPLSGGLSLLKKASLNIAMQPETETNRFSNISATNAWDTILEQKHIINKDE